MKPYFESDMDEERIFELTLEGREEAKAASDYMEELADDYGFWLEDWR